MTWEETKEHCNLINEWVTSHSTNCAEIMGFNIGRVILYDEGKRVDFISYDGDVIYTYIFREECSIKNTINQINYYNIVPVSRRQMEIRMKCKLRMEDYDI